VEVFSEVLVRGRANRDFKESEAQQGAYTPPMFVYHTIHMRTHEMFETLPGSSVNCGNGMINLIRCPSEKPWRQTQSTTTPMLCLEVASQEIT